MDIVDRLRELVRPHGSAFPAGWDPNNWAEPMNALLTEAANEIERLRNEIETRKSYVEDRR